jgi:hypothetical protein
MFQAQYPHHQNNPLFETTTLQDRLKQDHPTIILAKKINWAKLEDFCSQFYSDKVGRASKFVRLMIGLLILKYMLKISDEQVVAPWS